MSEGPDTTTPTGGPLQNITMSPHRHGNRTDVSLRPNVLHSRWNAVMSTVLDYV